MAKKNDQALRDVRVDSAKTANGRPKPVGLYDPQNEHDACGWA